MAKVGRPSKYTPELLKKAEAYLSDYNHHDAVFPSHIGLALYLGITPVTVYDWAKQEDKLEFSYILQQITAIQHEMLVGNGLTGTYNSNICKLALGKHGYKDQGALTGADDKPLIPAETELDTVRRAAFAIAKALKADESGE